MEKKNGTQNQKRKKKYNPDSQMAESTKHGFKSFCILIIIFFEKKKKTKRFPAINSSSRANKDSFYWNHPITNFSTEKTRNPDNNHQISKRPKKIMIKNNKQEIIIPVAIKIFQENLLNESKNSIPTNFRPKRIILSIRTKD